MAGIVVWLQLQDVHADLRSEGSSIAARNHAFGKEMVLETFRFVVSYVDIDALYDRADHPRIVHRVARGSASVSIIRKS